MADSEKRDPIGDLTDAVKKRPVESLLAYEILVPEKKKKEIEGTVIGSGFILLAVLLLLPLLFAPAMESFICRNFTAESWRRGKVGRNSLRDSLIEKHGWLLGEGRAKNSRFKARQTSRECSRAKLWQYA